MNEYLNNFSEMIPAMVAHLKNGDNLAKANQDPIAFFKKYGINMNGNMQYAIFLNDHNNIYFVMPEISNDILNQDQLNIAIGGTKTLGCASTAGSVASASTISSLSTNGCTYSLSTILSASTLFGCAATASTDLVPTHEK